MLAALADPIVPVFLVMALGVVLGRTGVFSAEMARALNGFVFYAGQPALMYVLASQARFDDYDWPALGLYFAGEVALYAAVAVVARRVFKRGLGESILIGMTAIFVNHLYFVLPIVELLHGDAVAAPVAGVVFVDAAVLFCGTIFVMELVTRHSVSVTQYPLLLIKNPSLVALVIGLAANALGPLVPEGVLTFADFAGAAAPPIALFALGVMLARVDILHIGGLLALVIGVKVALQPVLTFGLLSGAGAAPAWAGPLLLVAAGPCGAMPFVIALQYKVETETMAKAILISTVLTLFSLAALSEWIAV